MADPDSTLDEARREAGRAILKLTDEVGFDAYAAGWLHDRATDVWRYLLVTPMLRTHGPRWVYDRLLRVFRRCPLPDGVSPLDIYVLDPEIEVAVFGPPLLAMDERELPTGLTATLSHSVSLGNAVVEDGSVTFFRRLPILLRARRRNPAPRFDRRVRQLEAA